MSVATVRPRLDGPTPLSLSALLELTRESVAEVRAGVHRV